MNFFELENPKLNMLVFITQGGHKTKTLMKNIEFRTPKRIEKLHEILKNNKTEIGDVIFIDDVVFVILRKHYVSKVSEKEFERVILEALPKLEHLNLKTTNEDWPEFQNIILKYIPNIELRESSEWPYGK